MTALGVMADVIAVGDSAATIAVGDSDAVPTGGASSAWTTVGRVVAGGVVLVATGFGVSPQATSNTRATNNNKVDPVLRIISSLIMSALPNPRY
jgi:hypothetical protein